MVSAVDVGPELLILADNRTRNRGRFRYPEGVCVSDLSDLLVAIGSLVTALSGAFALVWTTVVRPRRGSKKAAERAAGDAVAQLLAALADGDLTREEIEDLRGSLEEEQ